MLKCPLCEVEISSLDHNVTATCSGYFTQKEALKGMFASETYDIDSLMGNVEVDDFSCPICNELLFFHEEQAIKFLKGEKVEVSNY